MGLGSRPGTLASTMTSSEDRDHAGRRSYRLSELAAATGQNPRTIRSWIERGLLRGPTSLGRGARYDTGDFVRVRAISTLREDHSLGLDEIAQLFHRLSLPELSELLETAPAERRLDPSPETALDYIRALRRNTEADSGDGRVSASEPPTSTPLGSRHRTERWLEVRVARGVHLKVRDLPHRDSEEWARHLAKKLRGLIDAERS